MRKRVNKTKQAAKFHRIADFYFLIRDIWQIFHKSVRKHMNRYRIIWSAFLIANKFRTKIFKNFVRDFGINYWIELDMYEKKLKAEETGIIE